MTTYDAIVIGAGQAGPGMASTFASEGHKVALIEGDKLGGTCLNYGCRPTKALRASAKMAHEARRMAQYGVHVGDVRVDFADVMARKDDIIGGMQASFVNYMENLNNVDVYHAYGHFDGKHGDLFRIQAGDDVLETRRVYLNTGARAFIPPIEGLENVDYLTNVEILALKELPPHLLIIGGSYIGLEFGQMFRRFGSDVTIIESSPTLPPREDADIAEAVENILKAEDITLHTGARGEKIERDADGNLHLTVKRKADGSTFTVTGTHLLIAAGRRPNSDNLNLESVGVQTDERGYIKVNGRFETTTPGIWALGDVNGRGAFTHTSYQDYEIAIDNYKGGDRTVDGRIMAYAMFIDPPLGRVGLTEQEVRDQVAGGGREALMAVYQMADVSRAQLESRTEGLIKILVDANTEQIIGAATLGMQGDDLIAAISNFMYTGASYKVMQNALPIHPTIGEFLPTILGALKPLQ